LRHEQFFGSLGEGQMARRGLEGSQSVEWRKTSGHSFSRIIFSHPNSEKSSFVMQVSSGLSLLQKTARLTGRASYAEEAIDDICFVETAGDHGSCDQPHIQVPDRIICTYAISVLFETVRPMAATRGGAAISFRTG